MMKPHDLPHSCCQAAITSAEMTATPASQTSDAVKMALWQQVIIILLARGFYDDEGIRIWIWLVLALIPFWCVVFFIRARCPHGFT